jgi:hypothetical protein
MSNWLNKFSADAENLLPPDSRQHFDSAILLRSSAAFAGITHPTIADWTGAKSADAENAPPDSRQHFDSAIHRQGISGVRWDDAACRPQVA